MMILNKPAYEKNRFSPPGFRLPTGNLSYCWYSAVTQLFELTRTVAILEGNAFARIENDAVIAAAKLIASIALTKKQKPMNIGPLGSLSSILEKKNPNSKLDLSQDGRSHLLKALKHNFLLIKEQLQDTQCCLLPF